MAKQEYKIGLNNYKKQVENKAKKVLEDSDLLCIEISDKIDNFGNLVDLTCFQFLKNTNGDILPSVNNEGLRSKIDLKSPLFAFDNKENKILLKKSLIRDEHREYIKRIENRSKSIENKPKSVKK